MVKLLLKIDDEITNLALAKESAHADVGSRIAAAVDLDRVEYTDFTDGVFRYELTGDDGEVLELAERLRAAMQKAVGFKHILEVEELTEAEKAEFSQVFSELLSRYPDGYFSESFHMVEIDGRSYEVRLFPSDHLRPGQQMSEANELQFGVFLSEAECGPTRYARKMLVLSRDGSVSQDVTGIIPKFDLREGQEPTFSSSNKEILNVIVAKYLE